MKRPNGVAATTTTKNDDNLLSEVASFASSLGLSSSLPSSGFNDSDFKKTGTLKQPKPSNPPKRTETISNNAIKPVKPRSQPTPKPPVLSLDDVNKTNKGGFNKYKSLPKLPLVKASGLGVWYVDAEELEKRVMGSENRKLEVKMGVEEWKSLVEKKRELGERLMWQFANDFEQSRGQSGDIKMVVATQRSGTAADKVSAFSVLVADNPIANLRSLDALLGMVTSKVGKRHALSGFEALKELFVNSLLPDRKLKTLLQRPVNSLPETKDGYSVLLFWYWEECLKQRYERFVLALEEASRDMLPVLKDKALKTMYALLKSKSEQERRLLSALVNKLGDPQNKGASNADFHLSNLLSDHPNMKAVVIDEVDTFLFRPHLGLRAKYHAINFLSQTRLSHKADGPKLAKRLIDVYFALFKVLISEAGGSRKRDKSRKALDGSTYNDEEKNEGSESHVELDSRLLSALLTGVNRAFPYVSSAEADDIIEVQTPMLFKLVHSKNFNVGVQALMLLDKISSKHQIVSERFYRALYSKLLLPAAMNSSKAEMFFGLLLRAMKSDVNLKRVAAFSKRVLQVALQQPPQYACGCLFLLSEVLKARPPLWNMVLQNESVDEDIEHFEDIAEENDEGPCIKSDQDVGNPGNKNDASEDEKERLLVSFNDDSKAKSESDFSEDEDEDEDENISQASSSEDDDSDEGDELLIEDNSHKFKGCHPLSDCSVTQPLLSHAASSLPGGYNPRHREPSFCNADRASWWELMVLASHVHPSVATMARTLLSGANIVYNGNPLNDLSLTAFLDKFMEKKPKQTTWHGGSQIEPAKKLDLNNHLIGPEILSLAEVDVPPEDLVFHKFYMNKTTISSKSKKKKKKKSVEDEAEEFFDADDADEAGGGDESDNEEIENMLDSTDVALEADGDYDYDDLDQVANEDDDDLIGNVSDTELELGSDIPEDEDIATIDYDDEIDEENDVDNDAFDIGDVDDGSDDEDSSSGKRKGKRKKSSGNAGASPFASLEEYEHLLNEDNPTENKSPKTKRNKTKSRKKRKSSK